MGQLIDLPMGTLRLHPTHPIYRQLKCPCCPVCKTALLPKDAVRFETYPENNTYTVFHEKCGAKEIA